MNAKVCIKNHFAIFAVMKKRPVSQKDIAKELGISISTVSRALKDSKMISEQTKQRVKALAKERNYHPNPFAIGLLKNTHSTIGIIVPDIVTHFYSSIISGISDVARTHGFSTIITSSYENYQLEKQCVESLENIRVEGIIACLSQQTTNYGHFERLIANNIPLVFFDRVCMENICPTVVVDNDNSANMATRHLIKLGCKRIGFIGGSNHLSIVSQRKHGYLEALRKNSIAIDKDLIICNEMSYSAGRKATRKLMLSSSPPDAILAINDALAFGAMKELKELGFTIPHDVALVGYTDELHSEYTDPSLTAITHKTYQMGSTACNLLLECLGKSPSKTVPVIIPTYLVIRESSNKNRVRG